MKKIKVNGGFVLSFIINLLFNAEWAGLAFILFLLHKFIRLPLWPVFAALGLWTGYVFITTLVLYILTRSASSCKTPHQQNKNPYSKTHFPCGCSDRSTELQKQSACNNIKHEPAATVQTNRDDQISKNAAAKIKPEEMKNKLSRAIMTYPSNQNTQHP